MVDVSYRCRCEFHRPWLYRYKVAVPGFRPGLNRYPGVVIGAYIVIGRYAYCVMWADARVILPPSWHVRG